MKIQNINVQTFTNIKPNSNKEKNTYNEFDYNKTLHPQEVLGRSSVNFQGLFNRFKFSKDDRKFIDSVAKNLNLSPKDKKMLEDITKAYLKKNNFTSLDDISGDEMEEKQDVYLELVGFALNMSEWDFNIFSSDLVERTTYRYNMNTYVPIERKYSKDLEVFNATLDNYNIDIDHKMEIFSTLEIEAEENEYNSLYDIFKEDKDASQSETMQYIENIFGNDIALDILIDFSNAALNNGKNVKINKTKYQDEYRKNQANLIIFKLISKEYGIDEENLQYILPELEARHNGEKSVPQIAYELADRYNLPQGAEQFIENTINASDHLRNFLKKK